MRRLASLLAALALVAAIVPSPAAALSGARAGIVRVDGILNLADSDATATLGASLVAEQVYAGGLSACAILSDDSMRCWGDNSHGELGDGTTTSTHVPVTVAGGHSWATADVGIFGMCAITTDGDLYCWGDNYYGQVGNGVDGGIESSPVRVGTDSDWIAVTGFNDTFCGLREGGSAWCWGYGWPGVIGDGDGGTSRNLPTRVIFSDDTNSTGFVSIDAGNQLMCGVTGDGALWCWGYDYAGVIGASPTPFATITKATRVGGANNWTSVATGYIYACARTATGAASCFGMNTFGQLGDGTIVDGPLVAVTGGHFWDDIGLGDTHTCGIDGGDLYCWGDNASGRVDWANGDASFSEPKRVAADASWSDVDNGSSVTCGITNGDVWCWGNNSYGMLGDADTGLINVARWVIDGAGLPPTSAELPWPSAALAAVAALLAVAGVALRRRSPARRFR